MVGTTRTTREVASCSSSGGGCGAQGTDAAEIVTAPSDGESPLGLTA